MHSLPTLKIDFYEKYDFLVDFILPSGKDSSVDSEASFD
jgi:hypothetical protein